MGTATPSSLSNTPSNALIMALFDRRQRNEAPSDLL